MASFAGQCDQVSLVKIVLQMTSFAGQCDQPLAESDQVSLVKLFYYK